MHTALFRVAAEVERCAEASRALLHLAAEPPYDPRPVAVGEVLREAVVLAGGDLEHAAARLRVELPELPRAPVDAVALRTAVYVLLRDAGAGCATVRLGGEHRGDTLVLRVEDDGAALPQGLVAGECNPFRAGDAVTAERVLGIGLARHVARRHGGSIELCGGDDGGLRAEMRLPA